VRTYGSGPRLNQCSRRGGVTHLGDVRRLARANSGGRTEPALRVEGWRYSAASMGTRGHDDNTE
jgi:hypothetical protein